MGSFKLAVPVILAVILSSCSSATEEVASSPSPTGSSAGEIKREQILLAACEDYFDILPKTYDVDDTTVSLVEEELRAKQMDWRYAGTIEPDMAFALNYIEYWVEFNQSLPMDEVAFQEATGFDKEEMMAALVWYAYEVNTKTRDVCEERYGIPFVAPEKPTQMN